ncbi:MAG TPA: hypothetical protein V6D05_03700 [Stenomitos sp.]
MSSTTGFTPRDIRLMIGFGLFVEVLVGYMLFIDGPLGQMHKLRSQLTKSQAAYTTLKEAVQTQVGTDARKLPPVLTLKPGESCSLAIQSFLERLTARHAVTPLGTTILAQEAPNCRVEAELQGSYEALGGLISELEHPEFLMGLEAMDLKTDPEDPDRIVARLTLNVFYREPGK